MSLNSTAQKKAASADSSTADESKGKGDWSYNLRLYVAGQTTKSIAAFANLKRLCEHMPGRYKIEVIDLVKNPELASKDQIFALPTLVRRLPPPLKRVIGNLSNKEKFLVGMDIKTTERGGNQAAQRGL